MRRVLSALVLVVAFAAPSAAQVVINPAPVPACANGDTLLFNGTTWTCSPAGGGTVSGSGTVGNIPKRSAATVLADSILSESAGVVTAAGAVTVTGNLRSNTALILGGATSGTTTFKAAAVAGTTTITFPGGTTDFSATGGSGHVVKQESVGAAFTVGPFTYGDLSSGAIITSTTGPHAVGGAVSSLYGFRVTGSQPAGAFTAFAIDATVNPSANQNAFAAYIAPTLIESGSGTHPLFGGLRVAAPMITGGLATLTDAATVYIDGAPAGAVSGANYALWAADGNVRLGGTSAILEFSGATDPQIQFSTTNGRIGGNQSLIFSVDLNGDQSDRNFHFRTNGYAGTDLLMLSETGLLTLYGGQLSYPASQNASSDANTLDDYEEGNWTPTDGSGAGLTFTSVEGRYVKIGQLVVASCTVSWPSTASGLAVTLGGLPFVSIATTNNINGAYVGYSSYATPFTILNGTGSGQLSFFHFGGSQVTNANMSGLTVRLTAVYRASS